MIKIKYSILVKVAIPIAIISAAAYFCFRAASLENTNPENYDEQMYTSSSIVAYHMLFNHHIRKNILLDGWFVAYAQKYSYDINRMPYTQAQWFDNSIWTFGWKSMAIPKYIMGWFITTFGKDVNPDGYFYRRTDNEKTNKWPGSFAPNDLIYLARIPNALLTIISIGLIYLIGVKFFNIYIGTISAFYILLNNHFIFTNSNARVSGAATTFSLLTLFLTLLFLKHLYTTSSKLKFYLLSISIGAASALSVGSKLNSALIIYVFVVYFATFCFIEIKGYFWQKKEVVRIKVKKRRKRKKIYFVKPYTKRFAIAIVLIGITVFLVFILPNPVLYDKPVLKMVMIKESIEEFFNIRARALNSTHINNSWFVSLWYIIKRNFVRVDSDYFVGTFGNLIDVRFIFLDLLFFVLGFYYLLKKAISRIRCEYRLEKESFLLIWVLVMIWGTADFMWIDWGRYYLPIYNVSCIIIAVGLYQAFLKAIILFHLCFKKAT